MFINSKKNFVVKLSNGELFNIPKNYIGEIPEEVAKHWLVRAAIIEGSIATPSGSKTKELERADVSAKEKQSEFDARNSEEPSTESAKAPRKTSK